MNTTKTTRYFFMGIAVLLLCNCLQSHSMFFLASEPIDQTASDTTVYEMPDKTAEMQDEINYFLTNNKYKDWKESDKKIVVIQGIVEQDGTITSVKILKSSQNEQLDREAIRLIKEAKYLPGQNQGKNVRSKYTQVVQFPPKKQ